MTGRRRLLGGLAPLLWLAPAACVLLPFFVFPLVLLIRNSFGEDDPGGLTGPGPTLANYLAIVRDPFYSKVFLETGMVAAAVAAISLLVGYPFAYAASRWSARWRSILLWAVYTPLLVSVIVRVLGWMAVTADSGLVNAALLASGLIETPVRILYEVSGMVIGMVHRYLPLMVLPLVNALRKIPPTLLLASQSLGAGRIRTFLRITLPLSLPGAVIGFQLVFASVLSDYVLPSLLGTTRVRMLAVALYDEGMTNMAVASASAMAVTALVLVLAVLAATRLALRAVTPHEAS